MPISAFLQVPPFPGAQHVPLAIARSAPVTVSGEPVATSLDAVRRARVGGSYWGARPALPETPYTLVATRQLTDMQWAKIDGPVVAWSPDGIAAPTRPDIHIFSGICDPWHLMAGASHAIIDSDHDWALVAALTGTPMTCVGQGRFAGLDSALATPEALEQLWSAEILGGHHWQNPFTGATIPFDEAVTLCAFWRDLIAANQDIAAALGIAFWKRPTMRPLLWNGTGDVDFADRPPVPLAPEAVLAVWKTRTDSGVLQQILESRQPLAEVEDGFIRSIGLGADCVPPLSIVVDRQGIYFDPAQPSDLESLLIAGNFPPATLERAARLRALVVASGISKYGIDQSVSPRRHATKQHILVPGQVEDDRSVQSGGGAVQSNYELLRRARADAPDAYILYKPHPDVEAGHRKGAIADAAALQLADEVVRDESIGALIDMVDALHVNTSLAGFEALLRGKPVTTHGVPFYAGWGVTRDLGAVPLRRNVSRSLDMLVAAALLLYPRYLDPVTGLPCPPEILLQRLSETPAPKSGLLVTLRRAQGRMMRLVRQWTQRGAEHG